MTTEIKPGTWLCGPDPDESSVFYVGRDKDGRHLCQHKHNLLFRNLTDEEMSRMAPLRARRTGSISVFAVVVRFVGEANVEIKQYANETAAVRAAMKFWLDKHEVLAVVDLSKIWVEGDGLHLLR